MKINTMAMLISDKNWSVAAAILGHDITSKPMSDSYGEFVVINTFEAGHIYRSPRMRGSSNELLLNNILLSAEDFQIMFDYDKRVKNLETFFEATQINKRPLKLHPDQRIDQAIQDLNEAWRQED